MFNRFSMLRLSKPTWFPTWKTSSLVCLSISLTIRWAPPWLTSKSTWLMPTADPKPQFLISRTTSKSSAYHVLIEVRTDINANNSWAIPLLGGQKWKSTWFPKLIPHLGQCPNQCYCRQLTLQLGWHWCCNSWPNSLDDAHLSQTFWYMQLASCSYLLAGWHLNWPTSLPIIKHTLLLMSRTLYILFINASILMSFW